MEVGYDNLDQSVKADTHQAQHTILSDSGAGSHIPLFQIALPLSNPTP